MSSGLAAIGFHVYTAALATDMTVANGTEIEEIKAFSALPAGKRTQIKTTRLNQFIDADHIDFSQKIILGISVGSPLTLIIGFGPQGESDHIKALYDSADVETSWKILLPNGDFILFDGIPEQPEMSAPEDDEITFSYDVICTKTPVYHQKAA